MKILPKSQVEFEIVVAWSDWEKYLDMTAQEVSEEIKIDGFRPGKAPRHIVEQKIGKEAVLHEASQKAVKKSYVDFILKEKIEAIGSPKVELLEAQEGKDLKYKVIVSVMPKIKVKEVFTKGIQKINEEYAKKSPLVEDKDLQLELERLAASRVKLVTVRREARKNDSVELDFSVLVGGVPIENGTSKNHPLIIGRGVFIPGFEEQIMGMREGEEKEFELNFPTEYHKKDLAGQKATFKVKMNLVQERQTPKIDDDFAVSLGKFKNLVELKKNMREGMEHENEHKLKDEKRAAYVEEIVKNTQGDLPEILIAEEVSKMMSEFEQQLQPMGMRLDQYLAQIKKNRQELEKDWVPQAQKRVLGALGLEEIRKMREIKVEGKDVEAEMNKTLQYYKNIKDVEKNIDMERLYKYSKSVLENEKVFEYLEKL